MDILRPFSVEADAGLIEEQRVHWSKRGQRQHEPLTLPTGELVDESIQPKAKPDFTEHFLACPGRQPAHLGNQSGETEQRCVGSNAWLLREVAE